MKCIVCGQEVPPEVRDSGQRKSSVCSVACRIERRRLTTKAWVERNPSRVKSYQAEYRKGYRGANPEYFREYYQQNRDRRKAETRSWYRDNTERHIAVVNAYREQRGVEWRRDVGRKSAATRRARTKDLFVDAIDHRVVFERDKGMCGICKALVGTERWEIDHVVPLSKGGTHAYANVQLSHWRCNRSKGSKVVP